MSLPLFIMVVQGATTKLLGKPFCISFRYKY